MSHAKRRWLVLHETIPLLMLIMLGFVAAIAIWAGANWLIGQVQRLRCPEETFLAGSGHIASILQTLPVLFASFGFGFFGVGVLVRSIPIAWNFFGKIWKNRDACRKDQKSILLLSTIIAVPALLVALPAASSQFCLATDSVLYQAWPWSGLKRYPWDDVTVVVAGCERGKGGWKPSFSLTLKDGSNLDIMATRSDTAVQALPKIARALTAVRFALHPSELSRCDFPNLDLFRRRS